MSYLITNQNNYPKMPYVPLNATEEYEKATIKSGGCGAISGLNCIENISDVRFTVTDWKNKVIQCGARYNGGTHIDMYLEKLLKPLGFTWEGTNDIAKVKACLNAGGGVIFHGGYGNVFSSQGHFVCIIGVSESGKAIVLDSAWYKGKYKTSARKNKVYEWNQNGVLSTTWTVVESDKKYKYNQGTNYYCVYPPKKQEIEDMNVTKTEFFYEGVKKGEAVEIQGTSYVKSRDIANLIGCDVKWDGAVHITKKQVKVYIEGNLATTAQIVDGYSLAPIRNIAEKMGYKVDKWDGEGLAVYLTKVGV